MKTFCEDKKMDFRPHFKTHQSAEIGKWFQEEGIDKCTVSSLSMAHYFAKAGWEDITVAIPFNINEIEEAISLAKQVKLSICVDHPDALAVLAGRAGAPFHVFIEIDSGYGRSGVHYKNTVLIASLIERLSLASHLHFKGFLSHTGNSYHSQSQAEGIEIFEHARASLLQLKEKYLPPFPNIILSLGDTPSSTFARRFDGIDEWRPGNFIFYDFMQYALGVCEEEDIAVRIYCPIIGIYPSRNEIVIYGGGVHLSKDSISYQNQQIYGWAKKKDEKMEQGFPVASVSQEHGIIRVSEDFISKVNIGEFLEIIPIHSCMTADLNKHYLSDNGKIIQKFRT